MGRTTTSVGSTVSDLDERTRELIQANEANWDARTPVHAASDYYGVGQRKPESWFAEYEWEDLGELTGRDLVHLQCHLGTETLAFARRGARVSGLDISGASIAEAGRIAARAGLDISYVRADVYDAVEALGGQRFDVVYTGKGALCYVPDLDRWARVVAGLLRPGGLVYVVESHPVLVSLGLDLPRDGAELVLKYDYLGGGSTYEVESAQSYTDGPPLSGATVSYLWSHGLGELVTALVNAGLRITKLWESPEITWPHWPDMVEVRPGWWRLPEPSIPLVYTLSARRD